MRSAAGAFYLAAFDLLGPSYAHQTGLQKHSSNDHDICAINPTSIVSDACASFSTLDSLNANLSSTIQSLTQATDFFSYYRLNLYNTECPFWSDESGLCGNIACAVNTIENEQDIPLMWRTEELGKLEGPKAHHPDRKLQQERQLKPLLGELGDDVGESCVVEYDDECDDRDYCVPEDESAIAKGDYVSLVDNPEKFTGYSGPSANQVWEAIYRENCFSKPSQANIPSGNLGLLGSSGRQAQAAQDLRGVMKEHGRQQNMAMGTLHSTIDDTLELDDECLEKRVFYRIISGMHASISTHLCWDYLNQTTGRWGPNLQCYEQRLHSHPERMSNLYFNYALVLRAVGKVRKTLENYTFCSGDPTQDRMTKHKVLTLADKIALGPTIYDETLMFQDSSVDGLKEDFRNRFRNVSRTMDCVGCDKCRLWGKLQTAGYGTALKILFEFDEHDDSQNPQLKRTEVVALINTLDKLSHSLSTRVQFEAMLTSGAESGPSTLKLERATSKHEVDYEQKGTEERDEYKFDYRPSTDDNMTFREEFLDEWYRVGRAMRWVMLRWYHFPRDAAKILLISLSRLWDYWLGRPQTTVWEFRRPSTDEI